MAQEIFGWLLGAGREVALILISALPIIELRGAIPLGLYIGMPWLQVLLLCYLGNLLPIPLVLILGEKVLDWLSRFGPLSGLIARYRAKLERKMQKVERYTYIGLWFFVAIPAPGTGAWTGAMIAALLGIKRGGALIAITAGVMTAGMIMLLASSGLLSVFGQIG